MSTGLREVVTCQIENNNNKGKIIIIIDVSAIDPDGPYITLVIHDYTEGTLCWEGKISELHGQMLGKRRIRERS